MNTSTIIHPLLGDAPSPDLFTYPFCYEPHPLAVEASRRVQKFIEESNIMSGEHGGKMFGVLVVEYADSDGEKQRGFLAAYSGLLSGRNDWPCFVPPVFDAQQPDGHFKQTERRISDINHEIDAILHDPIYVKAEESKRQIVRDCQQRVDDFRQAMVEAKARRDARRQGGEPIDEAERMAMTRESQYMKAELRRMRKSMEERVGEYDRQVLSPFTGRLSALQRERRRMSDDLQQWLFAQYRVFNARGEERDLIDIFRRATHTLPPAGAGDCCAPKLLQYAYANGLRPVCMAEFWWGESPAAEVRHHLQYYPACRSKCLPILEYMLEGLDVEPNPLLRRGEGLVPRVVYEDAYIIVVDKPAGMLSVPGKQSGEDSGAIGLDAESWLNSKYGGGDAGFPIKAVHRLDMDTSGILVFARTEEAYKELQRQFASREVRKRYEAVVDGVPVKTSGDISLPLSPDITDRPRQRVDVSGGKPAATSYEVTARNDRSALVSLSPHTGRTHQLRVHCAHPDGLGCPIAGDPLYGKRRASRMSLHAAEIEFRHPATGEWLHFHSPSGFVVS